MSPILRHPPPDPELPLSGFPLVSCLCITRGRPDFLRRAVETYLRQTWPRKELVVVVDARGETDWVDSFFHEFPQPEIRRDLPPPVAHLGALRNRSVDLALGDYVAVWDDDDWYHPRRLEIQMRGLLAAGAEACFLADGMHYFEDSGELFLTRWWELGLPPSMICRRSAMPRYTEQLHPERGQRGSDTLLQNELLARAKVLLLTERPYLYSYVFHGNNVWNRNHHIHLACRLTPPEEVLRRQLPGLRERLGEYYPVPVPEAVVMQDGGQAPL